MQINTLDKKINKKEWQIIPLSRDAQINIPFFDYMQIMTEKGVQISNDKQIDRFDREENPAPNYFLSSIFSANAGYTSHSTIINQLSNISLDKPIKFEVVNSNIDVSINIYAFIRDTEQYLRIKNSLLKIRISASREIKDSIVNLNIKLITNNAYIHNNNLLNQINESFDISILPELEVCSNSVSVNHSVSIGPLDKDIVFFLNCRGIEI
ncbi:MAG TPA: SufD family Fe-S cluster assembly protein [Candidatus Dojkabacteria bacterium]|nr:SufD family Fe-S cluster assembly protein [Candidatus Dojkabacteria bacterium]